jgi:hypothetical protein
MKNTFKKNKNQEYEYTVVVVVQLLLVHIQSPCQPRNRVTQSVCWAFPGLLT